MGFIMKFIIGFILGFIIATVGVTNFTNFLEKGLVNVQETVKENVK